MSPTVDQLYQDVTAKLQRHAARRRRKFQHEGMLPPDFCGQVFTKAREEAVKIRENLTWQEGQLARVNAELVAARAEVRNACTHSWVPGRRTGSVLFDFKIEPGHEDPLRGQLSPKALKMKQEKVDPLMRSKTALETSIYNRNFELGQLKKIVTAAGQGNPALIFFLSDAWRGRLQIGGGEIGKPAKLAGMAQSQILVDPFGNVIPDDAIVDGVPDLSGTIPWHGDHDETTLPGRPQDRNATFTKPEQVR